ncbi:hypothetical protein AAMO2058_000879800 [Amorphochlora amoebiformis]
MRSLHAVLISCICNVLLASMFILAIWQNPADLQLPVRSPATRIMTRGPRSLFGRRFNRGYHSPRVTLEPPVVDNQVDTQEMPDGADKAPELPNGYRYYETMLLVQPKLNEMEKDIQLSYFEKVGHYSCVVPLNISFPLHTLISCLQLLGRHKAVNVMKLDRGKVHTLSYIRIQQVNSHLLQHTLAYPMKKFFEAYFVLYSFAGPTALPGAIQKWQQNPGIESEGQFLRVNVMKQEPGVSPPRCN